MSDNKKIYTQLPATHQTSAIKNFFEATVEQLYSKSNVETIQGFIGTERSQDLGANGEYLTEPDQVKRFYGLSSAVNTVNPDTGSPEHLIFYDEFIQNLGVYGVDTSNHNKIFSDSYHTFMPPVDLDKLINFAEYYWISTGPTTINVNGTQVEPINISRDVLGQTQYTPPVGLPFRNGMIVRFVGDYVIPQELAMTEFIVQGVGEEIFFVPKLNNYTTRYAQTREDDFDAGGVARPLDEENRHSSALLTSVTVTGAGKGYDSTVKLLIADSVRVERNGDSEWLFTDYPDLIQQEDQGPGGTREIIMLNDLIHSLPQRDLAAYDLVRSIYDNFKTAGLPILDPVYNVTDGSIQAVQIENPGSPLTGQQNIWVFQDTLEITIDENELFGNAETVFTDQIPVTGSTEDIITGANIQGIFTGTVKEINGGAITLDRKISISRSQVQADPVLKLTGQGFTATWQMSDMHSFGPGTTEILDSQVTVGRNPNNPWDYYVISRATGFDGDLNDDGIGNVPWAGIATQSSPDYLVQARGATNQNIWSRVNFWFHRDNFTDAGDSIPSSEFRAKRPILEFDHRMELYNHGKRSLGFVNALASGLSLREVQRSQPGFLIDSVPADNATFVFPQGDAETIGFVYTAQNIVDEIHVNITGSGTGAAATVTVDRDGGIDGITVTKPGSGYSSDTTVELVTDYGTGAEFSVTLDNGKIDQIEITEPGTGYFQFGQLRVSRLPDPDLSDPNANDGDPGFVPLQIQTGDVVQILGGNFNAGTEWIWQDTEWVQAQDKLTPNQAPLFQLYDNQGVALDDEAIYPDSDFAGNPVFGYATEVSNSNQTLATQPDSELGFPLVFRQYKSQSEIVFENFQHTLRVTWSALNSNVRQETPGYYHYRLLGDEIYRAYWRTLDQPARQRIVTTYRIDEPTANQNPDRLWMGAIPDYTSVGMDVRVLLNGQPYTQVEHQNRSPGMLIFPGIQWQAGDFVEISVYSSTGLLDQNTRSQYEPPLSWDRNPETADILFTSEPEYVQHFTNTMRGETGFQGDPLQVNNWRNISKTYQSGTDIVRTNQDTVLGAWLLDNQPHNLVDAMRFVGAEYEKYRNRVRAEIDRFFDTTANVRSNSPGELLEQVLRQVVSYSVGANVFGRTYVLPYGDNYQTESFVRAIDQQTFTLSIWQDLEPIENSMLVYVNNQLLSVDKDYQITDRNPIEFEILQPLTTGDQITVRIYDSERDSAQCPPTPSTLGMMPLYVPELITDDSYQTPQQVILGHDGSRMPAYGDMRDQIMLEFEQRIYNSAKTEFRDADSLPAYNFSEVRAGAWRNTSYGEVEWRDLLRNSFNHWAAREGVDYTTNEFFDSDNPWTWNYALSDFPGHWRGIYEWLYDTQQPHTHPWEMLGFTEKPLWWDEEYTNNYTATNVQMWNDIEAGIIRHGVRENVTDDRYLISNPFRRPGLRNLLPVDEAGNRVPPVNLVTTGSTSRELVWDRSTGTQDDQWSFRTTSWADQAGLSVHWDDDVLYVQGRGTINGNLTGVETNLAGYTTYRGEELREQDLSWTIPRRDLQIVDTSVRSQMEPNTTVAVLVNGLPLQHISRGETWSDQGEWMVNNARRNVRSGSAVCVRNQYIKYNYVTPEVAGLEEWSTTEHSPVVGWALDGLPIYGPYVYSDPLDENSPVIRARSPWTLRTSNGGIRSTGPGGAYTGEFIQDYRLDSILEAQPEYVDRYNQRYGVTPDSNGERIHYYVVTVDENHDPVFPYHVGGGATQQNLWNSRFYSGTLPVGRMDQIEMTDLGDHYTTATVSIQGDGTGATGEAVIQDGKVVGVNITNPGENYTQAEVIISGDGVRATARVTVNTSDNRTDQGDLASESATAAWVSTSEIVTQVDQDLIQRPWRFGDGAPVENAWKYSEQYSYAVTEALLLAKPGRFARVFAAPDRLIPDPITRKYLIDRETHLPWNFTDADQFPVHGDRDEEGNFITNIGYTQFIHSWLQFQGAETTTSFVEPLRSLNIRLAHRMSGFLDSEAITVRTDQYSNDGSASSLIIPQDDITVDLHTSPYLKRVFYTGVHIERLTDDRFQVRGYDVSKGYFEILASDQQGPSSIERVGGTPASFRDWQPGEEYHRGNIVRYQGRYYEAPARITTGDNFERSAWTSLAALPQNNAAEGIRYARTTGEIQRVEYGTIFDTVQGVYDFLISLGRKQAQDGIVFSEFDADQNGVPDWPRSAKDFLFWTTDSWEPGNTLELSPCARELKFVTEQGFASPLVRSVRGQFSVQNNLGQLIENSDLDIVREDDALTITSVTGDQIYGVQIFVQRTEHALVFNNQTEFADVINNPVINQRHTRLRIRGKRTAGWTGRLLTEGFIVNDNKLLPNLDNLAESMGRYAEFGFVPVQSGIYEASRAQYGFTERDYLRELDILDEEQYDFYRGMIQSKGTQNALSRIARSSAIRDGEMTIYDEWALRIADFGDTDREQSIELKLTRSDIQQEPQLVKLTIPESVTNQLQRVDVLDRRYRYTTPPLVEITPPLNGEDPAVTDVVLDDDGFIKRVDVLHPGSGYGNAVAARVIAGDVTVDRKVTQFQTAIAQSFTDIDTSAVSWSIQLQDNVTGDSETFLWDNDPEFDFQQIADDINAAFGDTLHAQMFVTHWVDNDQPAVSYHLFLAGRDFTVSNGQSLNIANQRYQPRQRYAVVTNALPANNQTGQSDIRVKIDGTQIPHQQDGNVNWTFIQGSVIDLTPAHRVPPANDYENTTVTFDFPAGQNLTSDNVQGSDHRDRQGRYRFVELYINGTRIVNSQDIIGSDGSVIRSGTLFELTETGVTFPDVNLLPDSVLTTLFTDQAPVTGSDQTATQSIQYKGFDSNTRIRIIEKGSVLFDPGFAGDVPGHELNIQVVSQEGIAARLVPVRNFALEEQQTDPDVLVIDIDDNQRFLKKPTRVGERGLWPTISSVNHKGVLDPEYIRMPNAGYVSAEDVDFQAYDVPALEDLFSDTVTNKPKAGDLIHVAVSDDSNWNVYQLQDSGAEVNVLVDTGTGVELYSDQDLNQFIDVQEISNPASSHTYLNYTLSLSNKAMSSQVVQWRAQEIVQSEQSLVQELRAPQGVEARIQSIQPAQSADIQGAQPALSGWITGATLQPESGQTRVICSDTTQIRTGGQVRITEISSSLLTVTQISADSFWVDQEVSDTETDQQVEVWDHTELTVPAHPFQNGETVQIVSSDLTGRYQVIQSNVDTITVAAPYQTGGDYQGAVMGEGIEIQTWHEHGITPVYAKNGKRVMVQFADPLWLNQVYPVSAVTGRTVRVNGVWPVTADQHVYGAQVIKQVSENNNTIQLPQGQALGKVVAQYQSNSEIISSHLYSRDGDTITFHADALPDQPDLSVGIQVVAERVRTDGRYATLITLDSNLVKFDGHEIRVDNTNNANAVRSSIARAIQMRRAVTLQDTDQLTVRWAMLNNSGDLSDALVRSSEQLTSLVGEALGTERMITISSGEEIRIDETFNPGNRVVGPNMGIQYQDRAGNQFTWNPASQSYQSDTLDAVVAAPRRPDPEYHVTSSNQASTISRWQATTQEQIDQTPAGNSPSLAYQQGAIVSYGSQYFEAQTDIRMDLNTRFRLSTVDQGSPVTLWAPVENVQAVIQAQNPLIVKQIPGSGTATQDEPARAQRRYDLNKAVTLNGKSLPLYRLKPNADQVFAVYQAVINGNDDIYYLQIDQVAPLTVPHDFYGTINAHSDFGGYPTVNQYWLNGVMPEVSGGVIVDADDPVLAQSTGKVVQLPAAEPARYIGKQVVPEPFAVQGGNGSDALENFLALPEITVGASATGEATEITSSKPGYNAFSMWTPGLTPGAYRPTQAGPGRLAGDPGTTAAGFGRGYYQAGDDHLEAEYPVVQSNYQELWPRFLYARDLTVFPPQSNQQDVFYLDERGEQITLEQAQEFAAAGETVTQATTTLNTDGPESLDPAEIFVACFWTEPHRYNNQLIGWNFNQIDDAGMPAPVYGDYDGTVTRVKYIRLTELPADAQTQRIIPDTGWAGRDWNNQLVSDLLIEPDDITESVWSQFEPEVVTSGSSSVRELVASVGVPEQIFQGITPEPTDQDQQIVLTEHGPVLTGAVLKTLATPALGVSPLSTPNGNERIPQRQRVMIADQPVYSTQVSTDTTFRAVWQGTDAIAVAIYQSAEPYADTPQWWRSAELLATSGQAREYARNSMSSGVLRDQAIERLIGLNLQEINTNSDEFATQVTGSGLDVSAWQGVNSADAVATTGIGFLEAQPDQRWVTVIVAGTGFRLAADFVQDVSAVQGDTIQWSPQDAQNAGAPSREYQRGAQVSEWASEATWGYFGQTLYEGQGQDLQDSSQVTLDNIYYPYQALPEHSGRWEPLRQAHTPGVVRLPDQVIQSMQELVFGSDHRTMEIKGYFQAPVTGDYEFTGYADAGVWMWISQHDDLSGQEQFKQDGVSGGYTTQNATVSAGVLTSGSRSRSGQTVRLQAGKYYFVRIIAGGTQAGHAAGIKYNVTGTTVAGHLEFTGRTTSLDQQPGPAGKPQGGDSPG